MTSLLLVTLQRTDTSGANNECIAVEVTNAFFQLLLSSLASNNFASRIRSRGDLFTGHGMIRTVMHLCRQRSRSISKSGARTFPIIYGGDNVNWIFLLYWNYSRRHGINFKVVQLQKRMIAAATK